MTAIRLLVVSEMSSPRAEGPVLVDEGHLRRFAGYGDEVALTWTITERADPGSLDTPLPDDIGVAWLPGFASSRQFLTALPATCRALWSATGDADAVLVNVPSFPALPALVIARLRRRPAVALQVARWAQLRVGPGAVAESTPLTRVLNWLTALVASVLLVHGDTLVADLPGWARRKVVPVTLSSLDASDVLDDLPPWVPADPVRLVTVARLIRSKRVDVLVDAVAELGSRGQAARLVVAGDGPERPALQAHLDATATDGRVALLGWIDDASVVHRHLREADVFVFASEDEGLPLAVLEAMAMGTPVVSTPAGGLATFLVDEVDALVVPHGDAGAIADAVQRLADDPDLADRLRAAAVAKVRPLTRQAFVAGLVEVVRGQLGRTAA